MSRGVVLASGRGGITPSGRGSACKETCCDSTCATVYLAESCIPFLPPVLGCSFNRPPDLYICSDTLCATTEDPVAPGNVVQINGQCYQIQPGLLPRSVVGDAFLYDLPSVPCLSSCLAPGCIPESPFSLAEPCDPNGDCGPLYFCRSHFPECRTIKIQRTGGFPCCYKFDPAAPPALPPSGASVCMGTDDPVTIPIGCDIIDFSNTDTTQVGQRTCCECGDGAECNHHRVVGGGGIVGGIAMCDPPELTDVCCPTVTGGTRILVDYYIHIVFPPGSPSGGPTGFGNFTDATGILAPGAGGPNLGCAQDQTRFWGVINQVSRSGPLVNGEPDGPPAPSPYEAVACFCPLTMRQIQLPPGSCGCPGDPCCPHVSDGSPDGCDTELTCECLESTYTGTNLRNRWRLTWRDSTNNDAIIQITNVDVNIRVNGAGPPHPACVAGCGGRASARRGPRAPDTLPFGVRGLVRVEDWL
jgi:hypothetical protein